MKSFSQTVTKTNIDTLVPLKVPVAKLVIKDLIKGDGAVAYEQVVRLMVLLQQAGVPSVGLMTQPQEQ